MPKFKYLDAKKYLKNNFSKLTFVIHISENYIYIVIYFASIIKIICIQLEKMRIIIHYLQLFFFETPQILTKLSINASKFKKKSSILLYLKKHLMVSFMKIAAI